MIWKLNFMNYVLSSIHLTNIYQISGICFKWVLKSHQHGTNSRTPEKSPCFSLFASLSLPKDATYLTAGQTQGHCVSSSSPAPLSNMAATSHTEYWALKIGLVWLEMWFKHKIHTGFWRLSLKKKSIDFINNFIWITCWNYFGIYWENPLLKLISSISIFLTWLVETFKWHRWITVYFYWTALF